MSFDGEMLFWNSAGLLGMLAIGLIAFNIVYYGAQALRDLIKAWNDRDRR